MGKVREEIEWVIKDDTYFTSLIVWNMRYEPFQIVIFMKYLMTKQVSLKYYIKINDLIYQHTALIETLNNSDEETMFHITRVIRDVLDTYILDRPNQEKEAYDHLKSQNHENDILREVFIEDIVLEGYRMSSPDFGFYSLASNFHTLKHIILYNNKPNIDEEVKRLWNNYNQKQ